jgi:small GTP-binding protein
MTKEGESRIAKVVVLGDTSIGKSCLLNVLNRSEFTDRLAPTTGIDFLALVTSRNGVKVTLQLWDTAGQESQRALTIPYLRNADIVLLCFALDVFTSFQNVPTWKELISGHAPTAKFILVGTKSDIAEESSRPITLLQAMETSTALGCRCYIETSAKTGDGIDPLEQALLDIVLERPSLEVVDIGVNLTKKTLPEKNCC